MVSLKSIGQTSIQLVIKNIGTHKIDKVDAFDLSQKEFRESKYKDTLKFEFSKKTIDCYNIRYHENGKLYRQQIWLDTGKIKIEAHIDSTTLVIDSVFNSPIYYEHHKFSRDYASLYKKNDTTAISQMLLGLYLKNIDNPYSFVFANTYIQLNQNSKESLSKLKMLTNKQGDRFNWFILYPSVIERLNYIISAVSININDYTFLDQQNKSLKLKQLTKKYYILDFWFLACAPCIRDHKDIFKSQKILASKNAELISISTDSDIIEWKKYLSKHNYKWPNYLESKPNKLTEQLSINIFPTYIVLGNSGKIINTQNSFSDVLKWLDKE